MISKSEQQSNSHEHHPFSDGVSLWPLTSSLHSEPEGVTVGQKIRMTFLKFSASRSTNPWRTALWEQSGALGQSQNLHLSAKHSWLDGTNTAETGNMSVHRCAGAGQQSPLLLKPNGNHFSTESVVSGDWGQAESGPCPAGRKSRRDGANRRDVVKSRRTKVNTTDAFQPWLKVKDTHVSIHTLTHQYWILYRRGPWEASGSLITALTSDLGGWGGGQTDLSELQPEPSMRAHTHPHTHHQVAKNMLLGSTNVTGDSQIPTGCCVKRERKQQGARRERERHVSEGPGGSADRMRREESRDRCGDKELLKKMCQTHFYAIKRLKRFCFICDIIVFFLCFSAWVFHCVSVNEQRVCANPFAFESLC